MALDPGSRRIGVAVSDELRLLATPVAVVERRGRMRDIEALRALVREFQPGELVIGLALLPSGEVGTQARSSELFAEMMREEFQLPVHLWNESYSTVEAHQRRQPRRGRKRAAAVDAEAAAIFLQAYLDARR